MQEATIRLQELDGTWQALGTDRASGITAEGLQLTSNAYGPDTATFELHRDPAASWPDLSAFTPVEIEVGNQLCWSGRIKEPQVQDGNTRVLSVTCEGQQYHLDDDQINKTYANRVVADWKAIGDLTPVGDDWINDGTVDIQDGNIFMGWKKGSQPSSSAILGIVLDLGSDEDSEGLTLLAAGRAHTGNIRSNANPSAGGPMLNDFLQNAGGTVSNWVSGTAYPADAIVIDTLDSNRAYLNTSGGTLPAGAARTTRPHSDTHPYWSMVTPPQFLMAFGCPDEAALNTLANTDAATVFATYGVHWLTQPANGAPILRGSGNDLTTIGGTVTDQRSLSMAMALTGTARATRYVVLIMGLTWPASQVLTAEYGIHFTLLSTFNKAAYGTSVSTAVSSQLDSDVRAACVSNLKASDAIADAISSGAPQLDTSLITATSTPIQHLVTDGYKTPREIMDEANAYHGWITRVDELGRLIFKPQPTVPLTTVGSASGYEFTDQATTSGDDIYSRVIVEAQGVSGDNTRVARSSAQLATSTALTTAGATTLTADQAATIKLRTMTSDVQSSYTHYDAYVPTFPTLTGKFRAGVTYLITGSMQSKFAAGPPEGSLAFTVGDNGFLTGTAVRSDTGAAVTVTISGNTATIPNTAGNLNPIHFRLLYTPDMDQDASGQSVFISDIDTYVVGDYPSPPSGVTTGQLPFQIQILASTLAEARGIRRTFQLTAPGVQTVLTLAAIADAWLYTRLRAQFRGSIVCTGPTAIRQYATGDPVHPSRMLLQAGELIHLADRIDPDTGQLGRDARIVAVSYDHQTEACTISLDNRRDNLANFLTRLAG